MCFADAIHRLGSLINATLVLLLLQYHIPYIVLQAHQVSGILMMA